MRDKIVLMLMLMGIVSLSRSQDPVPKLIVSEIHMYHTEEGYVEITNIGDQPADLARVIFSAAQSGEGNYRTDTSRWNTQFLTHGGILDPGESFVVINYRTATQDPTNIYTPSWYFEKADYMLQYTKRGSTSGMRFSNGDDAFGLFYDRDGDNNFNLTLDTLIDEIGFPREARTFDVAGVTNASVTHAFIRKANVPRGNAGQWEKSAGVSAEDSEWIVVPYNPWRLGAMFTTVGNHGNTFPWDFSVVSGTVDANGITIPWGTWRDSVFKAIDVGDNMAWYLRWGPDTLQSNAIQTGDTLYVYLCGDEADIRTYPITVTEALEDNNIVIPRLARSTTGALNSPYMVTDGVPVIDTIYSIPFGTRTDTLLAYLEKASNATWEFLTFNGATRAEVMTGDKLVVTAKNGNKKEYYILTDEYAPSNNAYLETILINNDTLWGFSRNTVNYKIILSESVTSFPSISATTENNDARVTIKHPTFIRGTEAERTATIRVVAESDTIVLVYSITFDFARPVQRNELEPFFSQVICGSGGNLGFEIFNPSNVPISLADYMMVRARPDGGAPIGSLQDALAIRDSSDWDYMLNFGYYYDNSRKDEGMYFKEATNYNIDIEPFDVWFIKRANDASWGGPNNADFYCLKTDQPLFYDSNDGSNVGYWGADGYSYWLLKMENDSITRGLKSADDPDDWKFVDVFGTVGARFDHTMTIDGYPLTRDENQHIIRKGNIWKGNPEPYGSIMEKNGQGSSEWYIVPRPDYYGPLNDVGRHSGFIKPTYFKSTISSASYLVSTGIGNKEFIKGVFPGSTVSVFYENIIKADTGQVLAVWAPGKGERDLNEVVVTGDTLVVKSADLKNTTRYGITTGFLSANALLSSDIYSIGVSGTTGTISTVEHFTTINGLLSHLTLPKGAFMNIFDNQRRHVPLLHMAPDTSIVIDPVVSDSIFIEVIAEDGITKILYSLVMAEATEPYITSNVYYIYQDKKIIDLFVDNTNINTFMSHVRASSGAHINVYDKYDYERTVGNMYIDDKIVVTDQNQVSVIYTLHGFYDSIPVIGTSIFDRRQADGNDLERIHNIYPNPALETVNIDGLESGSKVAVINLLGDVIEIREAYSKRVELNLENYASGIYFVRIIKDQKSVTYKFIKQ